MNDTTKKGALNGLKILDCTRLLPGGFCTQLLADMGAEVIKIEEPTKGDYNRGFPPLNKEESGSFLLLNRNKKSVTLNFKSETGKDVFKRMAMDADIVVEGFRPGVMDRLGLGYDVLKEINPRIIYCAISGYGQTGPYRTVAGHDLNYMAYAGTLRLFGNAGAAPIVPGLSIADVGGGSLMAATGILAAVISRSTSGTGQFVDISMTDGAFSWLSYHGADWLFDGTNPRGGERPFIGQAPCYNVYQCKDDAFIALGIIEPHFWEKFCNKVNLPELINQQWPTGNDAEEQFRKLDQLFKTKSRNEWVSYLATVDIPFSPVNEVDEAFNDPQLQAQDMILEVDHPVEGTIPQLGFPIKLSETPCEIRLPPPLLGEHTKEELEKIGYDAVEVHEQSKTKTT